VISTALLLFIVLDPFGNLVTLNTLLSKSDPRRGGRSSRAKRRSHSAS
jgi:small neutral amino acid transporter SnatA (MarC family)